MKTSAQILPQLSGYSQGMEQNHRDHFGFARQQTRIVLEYQPDLTVFRSGLGPIPSMPENRMSAFLVGRTQSFDSATVGFLFGSGKQIQ